MAAKPLQRKITGFLMLLLLAVLGAFWIAVVVATNNHAKQQINTNLAIGERIFIQLLADREEKLLNSARVLTADFGFKQAVATQDKATIESVLRNHANRINADLMLLLSLNGQLTASNSKFNEPFSIPTDLAKAIQNSKGTIEYLWIDQSLYHVVLLPVQAPTPIAIAAVGFKINQSLANDLKDLTLLDITFYAMRENEQVIISTLPQEAAILSMNEHSNIDSAQQFFIEHAKSVYRKIPLVNTSNITINGYLTLSANTVFREFKLLQIEIFALSVLAIFASLLAGNLGARKLSRPLNSLASTAKIIARGKFHAKVETQNTIREIDDLAKAFTTMQTSLAEREAKIIYQSQHDALTRLLNRQTVIDILDERLQQSPPTTLYVVVFNIARLQDVNDSFGHDMGDCCLKEVATRIDSLQLTNKITSRLGGDEFLIAFESMASPNDALKPVKSTLTQRYNFDALSINLEFSFGVVSFPDNGNSASELIKKASTALDIARRDKTGTAFYDNRIEEEHIKKLKLLTDLRSELLQSTGQLFMCYQPKIDPAAKNNPKFEALIRWIHPEQGFISPELFIPLAEQAGLIEKVTDWVLSQVIQQISQWKSAGLTTQVAINLSAKDLSRPQILDYINQLLTQEQLPKSSISFEITESEIMSDPEQGISLLERFRANGFELALDDFGTGYSSLSQLKHMPVTELKIDKSFVLKLNEHNDDQTIVKSTIDLAHQFGLKVVAEGVENKESLNLLHEWGCNWIQGFYISKPLPAEDIIAWVSSYNDPQQWSALP